MRKIVLWPIIILLLLVVFMVVVGGPPRIWQLNAILKEDPTLADHPYRFRAVQYLNREVVLTTPRTPSVPEARFLAALDPELATQPDDEAALAEADKRFREHEFNAIRRMLKEPDVETVIWTLDRAWYHKQGIPLP